jgi:hypothetical protein
MGFSLPPGNGAEFVTSLVDLSASASISRQAEHPNREVRGSPVFAVSFEP